MTRDITHTVVFSDTESTLRKKKHTNKNTTVFHVMRMNTPVVGICIKVQMARPAFLTAADLIDANPVARALPRGALPE